MAQKDLTVPNVINKLLSVVGKGDSMTLEERDMIKALVAVCHVGIEDSKRRGVKLTITSEDMLMITKILDEQCNRLWIAENK